MALHRRYVGFLLVLFVALSASFAVAQFFGGRPATRPALFTGSSLPEPPDQGKEWAAPDGATPEKLISATSALFSQGMADPRGCEYRQIEVAVGNVWTGGGNPIATHGWVLPATVSSKQRFAVCWNGLVYPAASVGAIANIEADVQSMLALDSKSADLAQQRGVPHFRFMGVIREDQAVSFETMTGTKVCMLLRTGKAGLAEKYWDQLGFKANGLQKGNNDPYLALASQWAWFAFDRAVCAHMRGDDVVSAETARLLSRAVAEMEKTAANRGFDRPLTQDPQDHNRILNNGPYLGFLGPLPQLSQDEERRVAAQSKPLPLSEAQQIPDPSRRIAALIQDLEEIDERQWGQPGGVGVDASPIVVALEKEGQNAVEPLIACLESDNRLTRSVSFGRDFDSGRNLIPVAQGAYLAIGNILQTHEFGRASDSFNRGGSPGRKALVAEVKSFWQQAKGKSPAELWYQTLADDRATSARWLEAVEKIVQPADVEVRGGWVTTPERKPGQIPAMRGESLRNKTNPSVSELIDRRVPQVAAEEPANNSMAIFRSHDAARMALALDQWDAKAAVPVLKTQVAQCRQTIDSWAKYGNTGLLTQDIADMTQVLARSGEAGTLKEYAKWVRWLSPHRGQTQLARVFRPMAAFADDPDINAAAEYLFGQPDSHWYCLAKSKEFSPFGPDSDLVASSLIAVPAFLKNVLANLADVSPVGKVLIDHQQVQIRTDSGGNLGIGITDPADPLLPAAGEHRTFRVCDWYAWHVAKLDGSPEFEPYWPEGKRNDSIKQMGEFLSHWAPRFAPNDLQDELQKQAFDRLHMTFANLDHPATQEDVRTGRAIFSLEGKGQAKVVPVEPFPTKARWTTFKQAVVRYQTFDPKTQRQKTTTDFDQDGVVWQAEELIENGKPRRYYGFVGHHIIAKVPADEIKLIPGVPAWDPRPE